MKNFVTICVFICTFTLTSILTKHYLHKSSSDKIKCGVCHQGTLVNHNDGMVHCTFCSNSDAVLYK